MSRLLRRLLPLRFVSFASERCILFSMLSVFLIALSIVLSLSTWVYADGSLPPIMFVTQPPFGSDFVSVNATFGNHDPSTELTPRGGDLYIRYNDGVLRNLTKEAGYGLVAGKEIAVREPSIHWSGTKALFSMVIGGTTKNNYNPVYWQIYEVSGFGKGQTVQIRRLPQLGNFNNVSPYLWHRRPHSLHLGSTTQGEFTFVSST